MVKEAKDCWTGEDVAVKIYNKSEMSLFALTSASQEHFLTQSLKHPNILESKCHFEDSDNLVLVQELMGSDIRQLLMEVDFKLEE